MKNTIYNILNIRIAKVEEVLESFGSEYFTNAEEQQVINSLQNNFSLNKDEAKLAYNVGRSRNTYMEQA
jgi:hypothetical protein